LLSLSAMISQYFTSVSRRSGRW